MSGIKKVWREIQSGIEARISVVSFEMWFKHLVPFTVDGGKLVLIAPMNTYKNGIAQYKDTVEEAVKAVDPTLSGIKIITEEETENYNVNDETAVKSEDSGENKQPFDPLFTFDNFVVGDSNSIAFAAAEAVAKEPGTRHNPLFIYGGVGLGKTHIMHAIANHIISAAPDAKILYVTTEQFVNEFIDSLRESKENLNRKFREKYRNVDVLMIDDIQFLSGKTSTQEALFHTFNDLYQYKKQIVISSDRHPRELTFLSERLQSRFQCGLTVDITKPSIETRIAILQKKAMAKRFTISNAALFFIAENITSNIRELEGALSKVMFFLSLSGKTADDLSAVKEALKDDIDVSTHVLSMDSIAEATANYFNVTKAELTGKKKTKIIAAARQMAIYLINDMMGVPLASIGEYFGGRDHTTIMYARDKITDQSKTDVYIKTQIRDIKNMLEKK